MDTESQIRKRTTESFQRILKQVMFDAGSLLSFKGDLKSPNNWVNHS
jgi:hypothetical protein